MNRCLINRIKRISNTLHKDIVEPIKILCIDVNNGTFTASLTAEDKILEENTFKTEEELNNYIQTNNIVNVIKHICFNRI